MDIIEIKNFMHSRIDTICAELFPNGTKIKRHYYIGSIAGESGNSLEIELEGEKIGLWTDRATGEGGDIIKLWRMAKNMNVSDALMDIKSRFRLQDPAFITKGNDSSTQKKYSFAEKPENKKSLEVVNYLTGTRKLNLETLKSFKIETDGLFYYLPTFLTDGTLSSWKKIRITVDEKGKKVFKGSVQPKPLLFGWQALNPNSTEVVICEGELDAMSLHQYGLPALSIPNGAGTGSKLDWIKNEWDNLERFEEIYICMDSDEAGQASVNEMVTRLGFHRCVIVKLPLKDANECLKAGISKEDVSCCFFSAQPIAPSKLRDSEYFRQISIDSFNKDKKKYGQKLKLCETDEFFFRPHELTIWTGINGHGKSMALSQMCLDWIESEQVVCIASMEMLPEDLFNRLMRQATGMRHPSVEYIHKVHDWMFGKLWVYDHHEKIDIDKLIEAFLYAYKRYGVNHFIIDSLMRLGLKTDDYNGQKLIVDKLVEFKNSNNCHIHLVAHPRKIESEYIAPGKLAVSGTGDISNLTDNQIMVFRNKRKEDALQENAEDSKFINASDGYFEVQKQRNGEFEGQFKIWFDKDSRQFLKFRDQAPHRYVKYSHLTNTPINAINK